MAKDTNIPWTDHTFNGWIGCNKVSTGCKNCYAENLNNRFKYATEGWGKGRPRHRTSPDNWRQPLVWDRKAAASGVRRKVFCASMADVFDEEVPVGWRSDLFDLINKTPNLDWLLLTKRPEYAVKFSGELVLLPNVWMGVTVETQEMANQRSPILLSIPAAKRFMSIEPMLGSVDLRSWLNKPWCPTHDYDSGFCLQDCGDWRRIEWVICGGETGHHARNMDPAWVRAIRDQCLENNVPFFFKQWGGAKGHDAQLDGQEWQQFPGDVK